MRIMTDLIFIKVECHAGYKADEYPKSFYWDNTRFEIIDILDRWYQTETNPELPAANYYKVQTVLSGSFILKLEIKSHKWYLVI